MNNGTAIQSFYDIPYANNLPPIDLSGRDTLGIEVLNQVKLGYGNAYTDGPQVFAVDPNLWRYDHGASLTPWYYKNPIIAHKPQKAPLWMGGYNKVDGVNADYQYRSGRT